MSTATILEDVTDSGKFELLAMAILRRAKPEYFPLEHFGALTLKEKQ